MSHLAQYRKSHTDGSSYSERSEESPYLVVAHLRARISALGQCDHVSDIINYRAK